MQTISLQIKIGERIDNFNDFEEKLIAAIRQEIVIVIGRYLESLDKEWSNQFEREHSDYRYSGKVSRIIRFYFGEIHIKRSRYCCKDKKDVYPLDLFLPSGMLSKKVTEIAIDLSTEIPYARSSRFLQEILGVKFSGKGIWHLVQRKGLEERAVHEAERTRIFEDARDSYPQDWQDRNKPRLPVYIELDGTMVASRESGEERFEVKSGIMYRDIRQIGKSRYRLMDKKVYSSADNSVVFGERFYAFCRKHGLPESASKVFLSDGAGWLRTTAEYVFPLAEKRLDLYHLKKACSKVLNEEEMDIINQMIYNQSSELLIETIHTMLQSKNLTIKEQTDLLTYISQNRDSMNYSRENRNGSGGIEKNIGIHVGRRCKKQGMSWSHEGINNLLALRSKKLNQLWSDTSRKYKNCR
jgi:hypothetical protein